MITNDVLASSTIVSGQTLQLTVAATGDAPLSYQWYAGAAHDVSSPLGGETASILAIAPSATSSYWVRVSNACGYADSATATVSVVPCIPVTIIAQPVSITIPDTAWEAVAVGAEGTQPINVQWYIGVSGDHSQPVIGATLATLAVGGTPGTTTYWAELSNPCGVVESSAATVVVLPSCNPPVLVQNPLSTTIITGTTTTLAILASGSDPLSYQWFIGDAGDESSPVSGATNASLSVSPTDTTRYWVEITNSCGLTQSATAIVSVNPACSVPVLNSQPLSASITRGMTATLTVGADGTAPLAYQWYAGPSGDVSSPIQGATSTSFSATLEATASYWVRVATPCGSADSITATITVSAACIPVAISFSPSSVSIDLGASTNLGVSTLGTAPISYQWYTGSAGDISQPLDGAVDSSLLVAPAQSASYWVRASNSCGTADSAAATVTVVVPCDAPLIASQPQSQSIATGGTASLNISAIGTDPFSYQWYIGLAGDISSPITGATSTSISVSPTATTSYWSQITNRCGSTNSDTATVTIHETCLGGNCGPGGGPQQTVGTRLAAPAHLTATARKKEGIGLNWQKVTTTAGGSPIYQVWRSDGTRFKPIATPNASSYHDSGVKKGVAYRYFVIAIDKNGLGSGPSDIATAIGQ